MVPHLIYHTAFKMDDGTDPDLTVGNEYELNCAFKDGEVLAYQILDDTSMIHTFHDDEEWFSKHFRVVGGIECVLEEI